MKQEGAGGGARRGQDKAWREYYAILAGTTIKFYRDKKDALFVSSRVLLHVGISGCGSGDKWEWLCVMVNICVASVG